MLEEDAPKNQTVVWVTTTENHRLPFDCYVTEATKRSRDPDPLIYLREKWYSLRVDSDNKPYIGARRTDIETEIAREPPARETVETPLPVEERPTSPDSIDEPSKRQEAPIPSEFKMGTSTTTEVRE